MHFASTRTCNLSKSKGVRKSLMLGSMDIIARNQLVFNSKFGCYQHNISQPQLSEHNEWLRIDN